MRRRHGVHFVLVVSLCALVAAATGTAARGMPCHDSRRLRPVRTRVAAGPVEHREGPRPHRRRSLVPELQADPRRAGRALAGEREGEVRPRDKRDRPDRSQRPLPLRGPVPDRLRGRPAAHPSPRCRVRPRGAALAVRAGPRGPARLGQARAGAAGRLASTLARDRDRRQSDQHRAPRHRRNRPRAAEPAGCVGPRVRDEPEVGGDDARSRRGRADEAPAGSLQAAAGPRARARRHPARSSGRSSS